MFTKIDIAKFALFDNFTWKNAVKEPTTFKKVNIIYGRNYSGKTTLSRIFRCVEKRSLNEHYPEASFLLYLDDNKTLSHNTLGSIPDDIKVRVYNSDFVKDNLSWLQNSDGTIQPFTLLGQVNVEIEKQIQEIDSKLGNESDKTGLLFDLNGKLEKYNKQDRLFQDKKSDLEKKLTKKAKSIKEASLRLAAKATYQVNDIKKDIPDAIKAGEISAEIIDQKINLLKQEPKADISRLPEKKPNFSGFAETTNRFLTKEIAPSKPITDLINDSLLQEWVRQGITHHKDKRKNCGFCGNPIPDDLWHKIDAHFNKESEDLRGQINIQIDVLTKSKTDISDFLNHRIDKTLFYSDLHEQLNEALLSWEILKSTYLENLDKLIQALQEREKDIFCKQPGLEIEDVSDEIVDLFKKINDLIEAHNGKTATLSNEQTAARRELLLSEIAKFLDEIDYQ